MIFDEATSSLDPESEAIIQQRLAAIARGRTIILVTHRLSFVARADAIIAVDGGHLVQVILWQNSSGAVAIWEMNGTTPLTTTIIGNPGPTWHA